MSILEQYLEGYFAECGITAKAGIFSFSLTSESSELYNAAMKEVCDEMKIKYKDILPIINICTENEGQPILDKIPSYTPPLGMDPGMINIGRTYYTQRYTDHYTGSCNALQVQLYRDRDTNASGVCLRLSDRFFLFYHKIEAHIPNELKSKVHYLQNDFADIWEWSEKVYEYAKHL